MDGTECPRPINVIIGTNHPWFVASQIFFSFDTMAAMYVGLAYGSVPRLTRRRWRVLEFE
jgi:hypothetical protein